MKKDLKILKPLEDEAPDELKGDEEEIVSLITTHQTALMAYLRSLGLSYADAQDLLQRANVVIWRKREQFEIGTSFRSWAFSIARWEARAFFKARGRKSWLLYDDEVADLLADRMASVPEKANTRFTDSLALCLQKLSSTQRQLIMDRYGYGMSYRECADRHNRSEGGMRVTLHRIRQSLRKCITNNANKLGE